MNKQRAGAQSSPTTRTGQVVDVVHQTGDRVYLTGTAVGRVVPYGRESPPGGPGAAFVQRKQGTRHRLRYPQPAWAMQRTLYAHGREQGWTMWVICDVGDGIVYAVPWTVVTRASRDPRRQLERGHGVQLWLPVSEWQRWPAHPDFDGQPLAVIVAMVAERLAAALHPPHQQLSLGTLMEELYA